MSEMSVIRVVFPLLVLLVVAAQTAMAEAQPTNDATEELLVISQKRVAPLSETPAAITVVQQDYLQNAGLMDLNSLQQHVPSFSIQHNRSPFATAFRIRSIGNEGNIPNFEPDVALYIDGALRVRSGLGMGDLLEIEHVEIMKGPQSTLYGKNATAGVINIISVKPQLGQTNTTAEFTLGSHNERRLRASFNTALNDSSAARFTVLSHQRDGWMKNLAGEDANETDHKAIRLQYLLEPTDSFSIRLIASSSQKDMICCSPDVEWSDAGLSAFQSISGALPADSVSQNRTIAYSGPHQFDGDSSDITAIIQYELDSSTLTSISSYDEYDYTVISESSYSELSLLHQNDHQLGDTFSQELRLNSSTEGRLDWLAGLYYIDSDFARDTTQAPLITMGADWPAAGPGLASITASALGKLASLVTLPGDRTFFESNTDTKSISIFGQIDWELSPGLNAILGARYLEEEKAFDVTQNSVDANGTPIIAVLNDANPANDIRLASAANTLIGAPGNFGNIPKTLRETDAWAWSAALNWSVNSQLAGYATLSHGFKSGGFNGDWGKQTLGDLSLGLSALLVPENPADREFQDEEVDHIELGMKTRLNDNRILLNMAVFDTEYTDLQVAAFTGINFIIANAAKAEVSGVELELELRLTGSSSMYFSATQLDTEYRNFTNGLCGNSSLATDCSGFPLPFAADLQAHIGGQFTTEFNGGEIYSHIDWGWSDEYFASTNFLPDTLQEDYSTVNFNIGWRRDKFDISLWGKNITDEDYQIFAASQPLYGGILRYLNEPRTYGLTIELGF